MIRTTVVGWLCLAGVGWMGSAKAAQPNFVVILADDLGYGDISPYGGWIQTPHLDRLASEGLVFTDFHSSGNVCSPTRAGFLTGRYQQRAGIPGVVYADPKREVHYTGLRASEATIGRSLKVVGYKTALFGKWHLGYQRQFNPVHHGFDEFRGYVSGNVDYHSHRDNQNREDWWRGLEKADEDGYVTHLVTRHGRRFIRENRDHPFFLYLAHEAVHDPYQAPQDPVLRGPQRVKDKSTLRPVKEVYRDMMVELDNSVGEIIAELKEQGIAESTLVFFFSDNGANRNGSNQPLRGHKGSNWEGGHRVPAIAWWPGKIKPGRTDELTISLDLMPTLMNLAGMETLKKRSMDGIDLRRLLLDGQSLGPRQLFWNGKAMREGKWKLISSEGGEQLFDLGADISESNDVAAEHPGRVARMKEALANWIEDVHRHATPQPIEKLQ